MSVQVTEILHRDSTVLPGHWDCGARVSYGQEETLKEVVYTLRGLAHEFAFLYGTFHEDEQAVDAQVREFPDRPLDLHNATWVVTALPHNELNYEKERRIMANGIFLSAEEKSAMRECRIDDHVIVLRTEKMQQVYRKNVTAITHFPAALWAIKKNLAQLIASITMIMNTSKDEFACNISRSAVAELQEFSVLIDKRPLTLVDFNEFSQFLERVWGFFYVANTPDWLNVRSALRDFTKGVQRDLVPHAFELPLTTPNTWLMLSGEEPHYYRILDELSTEGTIKSDFYTWPSQSPNRQIDREIPHDWSPASV